MRRGLPPQPLLWGRGEGVSCGGSQALEGVVEEQNGNNSPAGLGLAEAWLGRAGRHPNRKQHRGSGSSNLSLRVGREQTEPSWEGLMSGPTFLFHL